MNVRGFLVLNRLALMRRALAAGVLPSRHPAVPVTFEDAFRKYRGFDGEAWPRLTRLPALVNGLAEVHDWATVRSYAEDGRDSDEDVIYIDSDKNSQEPQSGWTLAGLDVGFYESEHSHFSIVLNEVIFGLHFTLRAYAVELNDNFLFRDESTIMQLLSARAAISNRRHALETLSSLSIVKVFVRK